MRRIAEVHRDPLAQAGIGGNPNPQGSHTTYTDREYVWGPDYVDECLWQIDRPGNTAFVLQDANFNVVGLTDPQGALLQQYDYDPYGTPTAIDTLGNFGHNRLGHQGLFADRYDTDAPAADLAVDADLMYYARNRDYRPDLGRWVQRDPNETATATPGMWCAGASPYFALVASHIGMHYADGMNTLGHLGQDPLRRNDPRGLFFGGIAGVALNSLFQGMDFVDALEEVRYGIQTSLQTRASIDSYAYDQEADTDWALSWDRADFEFSRGGSAAAIPVGARLARQKGKQTHHIATNADTSYGRQFRELFASADLGLEIPENKIRIPHGGRHPQEYHQYVFERLEQAVEGKKTASSRAKAIKSELEKIGDLIKDKPEFIYDTVSGRPTEMRGRRRRF